ncbi:MAG: hypothetical protein HZB20_05115 [Chloroflexi bacterium]|nr:hypothetical protein [Chloroflexota bacterium]
MNYYEGLAQSPEEIYYPTIKTKYVNKAEDICRPQNGLESAGRFPVVLEAARRLKAEIGERVPLGMWVLGPFTLAGQVVELDDLLKMPMKDPDGLQKILDALSDYLIDVLKMYRAAGADYLEPHGIEEGQFLLRRFIQLFRPQHHRGARSARACSAR